MGEDGSFVFKTCKSALEIAAKMSGAKNSKGKPSHSIFRWDAQSCSSVQIAYPLGVSFCDTKNDATCHYGSSMREHVLHYEIL